MKTDIITNIDELEDIIKQCNTCHVSMVDKNGEPYVLPFNFSYNNGILYLHSGKEGKKYEIFSLSAKVCVAFTIEGELYHQSPQVACSYGMAFCSVLLYGHIEVIDDFEEKTEILHHVMHKYTPNRDYTFSKPAIENVACFRVKPEKMTGRKKMRRTIGS